MENSKRLLHTNMLSALSDLQSNTNQAAEDIFFLAENGEQKAFNARLVCKVWKFSLFLVRPAKTSVCTSSAAACNEKRASYFRLLLAIHLIESRFRDETSTRALQSQIGMKLCIVFFESIHDARKSGCSEQFF
jgi:hypothetical protein